MLQIHVREEVKQLTINRLGFAFAMLVAATAVLLNHYLHHYQLLSQAQLAGVFFKYSYPAFVICAALVQLVTTVSPLKWALLLMTVFYVGMVFVFGAQVPPLEILLLLGLALPCIAAGYLVKFLKSRASSRFGNGGGNSSAT